MCGVQFSLHHVPCVVYLPFELACKLIFSFFLLLKVREYCYAYKSSSHSYNATEWYKTEMSVRRILVVRHVVLYSESQNFTNEISKIVIGWLFLNGPLCCFLFSRLDKLGKPGIDLGC